MQRGEENRRVFFKLYNRTSVDRVVDRHAQFLDRSTARSTKIDREKRNLVGQPTGRLTFPVSPAVLQDFARSTVHLGWLTERSTDSRVRAVFGSDLELIWEFFLLFINRGCEPILEYGCLLVRVLERTL